MEKMEQFLAAINSPWQALVVCVIVVAIAVAYIFYVREVTKW